ncbi:unnamed protein product, partial [Ixodes hexagonus]
FSGERRASATSLFYSDWTGNEDQCLSAEAGTFSTHQSAQLPSWLWLAIARCLRVPLPSAARCRYLPSLGLVLQALTLGSGMGLCVLHVCCEVRAILLHKERQDTLHRSVSAFIVLAWCLFGIYARRLARRLFSHPAFLRDIRMHSKTMLKINVAALAVLVGAVFVGVNAYSGWLEACQPDCDPLGGSYELCMVRFGLRLLFSVLALLWNGLVCLVLVSVARTHTIGIRRFITELESDAVAHEKQYSRRYPGSIITSEDICQESIWIENNVADNEDIGILFSAHQQGGCPLHNPVAAGDTQVNTLASQVNESTNSELSHGCRILSVAEILGIYWKISCRLRLSGIALQRWVACLLGLVVAWCSAMLVTWLHQPASFCQVVEFACPLTVLLIVCACIAEVNVEGVRLLKCIRPTEDRVQMINYITKVPLQLLTFGFAISYGTITTVVLGVLVAFTSRLIIVEIQGH